MEFQFFFHQIFQLYLFGRFLFGQTQNELPPPHTTVCVPVVNIPAQLLSWIRRSCEGVTPVSVISQHVHDFLGTPNIDNDVSAKVFNE